MVEKSRVRSTVEALSGAALVLRGRLFEADADSVTVETNRAHYEVLREYIANAPDLAKVKPGDPVEVRVTPEAKVIEKRVIGSSLPGVIGASIFGQRPISIYADDCYDCSFCTDCTECSYCVCDCTECSDCLPGSGFRGGFGGFARGGGRFSRFVRR